MLQDFIKSLIYTSALLIALSSANAQNENWTAHFSYRNINAIQTSNTRVYAAVENALFVYDNSDGSRTTYTSVDGLSGDEISSFYYSENFQLIFIGYENGLLESIDENSGDITRYADIQNQQNINGGSLVVNNFFEANDFLYIATGFGVVTYNLAEGVFGDTYFLGDSLSNTSNVLSVGVADNLITAGVEGVGTYTGDLSLGNQLLNVSNWDLVQSEVFTKIIPFNTEVLAVNETAALFSFNDTQYSEVLTAQGIVVDIQVNEDAISLTTNSSVERYDQQLELQESTIALEDLNVNSAVFLGDTLVYASDEEGLFKIENQDLETAVAINPDGPRFNNAYKLDAYNGELWMVYGNSNIFFNDFTGSTPGIRPGDIDNFSTSDLIWTNYPFSTTEVRSIHNVLINREAENEVYFSSYRDGLLKFDGAEFLLFNSENSNLRRDGASPETGDVRVSYATFGSNNNLWIVNNRQSEFIKEFSTNPNNMGGIDFESIIAPPENRFDYYNADEFVFDSGDDNVYIATIFSGLTCYQFSTRTSVVLSDSDTQNIPSEFVKSVALDKNGELWIGTTSGLRKISNPEAIFSNPQLQAESIIFEEGGIAQELLADRIIFDIKVDANNNKWIATSEGGVFYVSEDGQETIYNFTEENSPLPSNSIADIAIDESTGSVFFATEKGLMEFNSNITASAADFEGLKVFPNPVRPEYGAVDVTIQGLTAGANVKITDVEGNLVFESENDSFDGEGSGTIIWDTRSFSGQAVASGVYLVIITGEEAIDTTIEKLLIVR